MTSQNIVRWAARLSGALLVLLLGVLAIGEGVPDVFRSELAVQLQFLGIAAMLIGFVLGWFFDLAGGLLALAGFALFVSVELTVNGSFPGGAIPLFAIPGLLFFISAMLASSDSVSGS